MVITNKIKLLCYDLIIPFIGNIFALMMKPFHTNHTVKTVLITAIFARKNSTMDKIPERWNGAFLSLTLIGHNASRKNGQVQKKSSKSARDCLDGLFMDEKNIYQELSDSDSKKSG